MPELPEVETVVNSLKPALLGRLVVRAELRRADFIQPIGFDLSTAMAGRTIASIHRRGKRIVLGLDDGNSLYLHLGMTGQLTADLPDRPEMKHTHLVLHLDSSQIRFVDPRRFGGIFWLGSGSGDEEMGPEPLLIRVSTFQSLLRNTTRAIKSALLDQKLIAGLGNIYVDESLFRAGIHPLRRADSLTEAEAGELLRAIREILRRAIRLGGSSIRDYIDANGRRGTAQSRHQVYDRADEPCRTCRSTIERIVLQQRSTHFCPSCQPIG